MIAGANSLRKSFACVSYWLCFCGHPVTALPTPCNSAPARTRRQLTSAQRQSTGRWCLGLEGVLSAGLGRPGLEGGLGEAGGGSGLEGFSVGLG